jgi:DNA-binding winged helix-turn-helix (wHTH) protein
MDRGERVFADDEPVLLRFGRFELQLREGELRKDGVLVRLQPQPYKLLVLLLRRPGELVTRDEVRRALWGETTFVDFQQGVGFCVKQLRAALGDDARRSLYVQTLPRRGYRFVAPVRALGAALLPGVAGRRPRGPFAALLLRLLQALGLPKPP